MGFAPRKLGSLEQWLVGFSQEARHRGFSVDAFTGTPIHPAIADRLREVGVGWKPLDVLSKSIASIARLAQYDLLHITLFTPRHLIPLLAYAALPAKVFFFDGRSGGTVERPDENAGANLVGGLSHRLIGLRLSALAAASNYVLDRDRALFGLSEKARTIYNGVDLNRFAPRRAANAGTAELNILTVANLIREKGIDFLIRAFAQMRDETSRLTIVGDGPQQANLKNLAASLGVADRVRFLGLRDDIELLLNEADIFVHPAIWQEAFGLTIAEAMACERPVIASSVGGIPELIADGDDGVLVPPRDASALSQALDDLVGDPKHRRRLARNARRRVRRDFSLDRCIKEHLDWSEELLRSRAHPELPIVPRQMPPSPSSEAHP